MKQLIGLLFLLFVTQLSLAQIANLQNPNGTILREVTQEANMNGSPYAWEDWKSGELEFADGTTYSHSKLKFNAYKDVLEVYMEEGAMEVSPSQLISFSVVVASTNEPELKFKNQFPATANFTQASYFQVLYESDEIALLKKPLVTIYVAASAGYNSGSPERGYSQEDKYFVFFNSSMFEVGSSKKEWSEAFEINENEVKNQVKQNNLKLRKEEDMIALAKLLSEQ